MPVVVNEFEVVAEPATHQPQASAPAGKPAPPVDMERAIAEIHAREMRVRTY